MPDKKPPTDVFELAKYIIDVTEGKVEKIEPPIKNSHAQALSKLGSSKGGKTTASKMTPKELSERARKAALTRWKTTT